MARSLRQQRRFRWWQLKYVLCVSLFGEDEPIFTSTFHMGWLNHQPEEILIKGRMFFIFVFFGGKGNFAPEGC